MDLARLCRHRADPRGSTGHQSGGDGCGREFLGSSERQTRHVLPQRWLDHPVEWRIQGGRNSVHVRKNRSPGEPDLPWSHKGATLDPGGTYFRVIVIVCVCVCGRGGSAGPAAPTQASLITLITGWLLLCTRALVVDLY